MPLSFAEAYDKICPEGGPVAPRSKEFSDIMELMRQSGYVPFQDTLVKELVPKQPTTELEAKQYIERPLRTDRSLHVSKREWLSVVVNKTAFQNHLALNSKK